MINDIPISQKLLAGILTLSAAGLISGVVGAVMLTRIDAGVSQLADYAGPMVETTDDLIYSVAEAHKVAIEMLADEEPEDIARRQGEFDDAAGSFNADYATLDALVEDAEIQSRLERAAVTRQGFLTAVEEMIESHQIELAEETEARLLMDRFDAAGDEFSNRLEAFAQRNETEMQTAEDEADRLTAQGGSARQINDLLGLIFEEDYPTVEASKNLQRIVEELEAIATRYLTIEARDALATIREEFASVAASGEANFQIMQDLAETEEDLAEVQAMRAMFYDWVARAQQPEQVFDTHDDMLAAELEADIAAERVDDMADQLIAELNVIADRGDQISQSMDDSAAAQVQTALIAVIALSVVILALATGLFLVIRQTIAQPLSAMINAMTALADGDLDVEVARTDRADEIGLLSNALSIFHSNALEKVKLEEREAEVKAQAEAERKAALNAFVDEFDTAVGGVVPPCPPPLRVCRPPPTA